jgi:hypothetical protein
MRQTNPLEDTFCLLAGGEITRAPSPGEVFAMQENAVQDQHTTDAVQSVLRHIHSLLMTRRSQKKAVQNRSPLAHPAGDRS